MSWIANSLWEIGSTALRKVRSNSVSPARSRSQPIQRAAPRSKPSMQQRYDALVDEMKTTYGIRVRKWRTSSSGVAWTVRYLRSGKIVKLIESPYPRGPMSCAIFLHEVGHHAIGLGVYKPRCLEEYRVWLWALEKMRERGFNVTPAVERRMTRSMQYAVAKARRRGIRNLPSELQQFL